MVIEVGGKREWTDDLPNQRHDINQGKSQQWQNLVCCPGCCGAALYLHLVALPPPLSPCRCFPANLSGGIRPEKGSVGREKAVEKLIWKGHKYK